MLLLDYIPQTITNPYIWHIKYSIRKRIFHSGWALSYCNALTDQGFWILVTNTETKQDAINIVNNSHH